MVSLVARGAAVIDAGCAVAGLPLAAGGAYLAALSIPATLPRPEINTSLRMAVVVPAHNEAADIAATVMSLLACDYPAERRRVVVVADNCTDDTADRARAAGAEVLVRQHADLRGKGYALEFAFNYLLGLGTDDVSANDQIEPVDGVVVVDADTLVSRNLLTACSSRLARGDAAVQADYRVRDAGETWRTRLLRIAFTAFHEVRSTGRERYGLSCGLRGNGMAFAPATLRKVPHAAFSIVEDLEYGIALGRAGIRVVYAHEAWVEGRMPGDAKSSESQRDRWEGGRALIRRREGTPLVREAIRNRDRVVADLAADVWMPPLGQFGSAVGLGAVVTALGSLAARRVGAGPWRSPWVFALALAGLGIHAEEGWRRSGTGIAGLSDLACAPMYVVWKLARRVRSSAPPTEWVRTDREPSRTEG